MQRAKHIATLISFIAAIMLLSGPRYAHAQNSFSNPFVNSWQKYQVLMGNTANSVTWELWDDLESPTIELELDKDDDWVDYDIEAPNAYVEIKFYSPYFDNGETWYLVYSEWDDNDNCVAMRFFEINIAENTFFLSLGADENNCNSLNGEVLNWDNVNGLGGSGIDTKIESYVEFTVQMNKKDNFAMNSWSFNGATTFSNNDYDFVRVRSVSDNLSGTSNAGENFTISGDDGTGVFSVIVDAAATTATEPEAADYTDYIILRVYVSGLVHQGETIILDIDNGKASSGINYIRETNENTSLGGDREQRINILPLPATSNIAIAN